MLFLRVLPAVVLGPLAGYIADRLDRRWTLIVGDVLRGAVFATIPIVDTLAWVLVATVIIEAISLVWLPAKDATIPNLVPREQLEAANQISIATTYGSALPAARHLRASCRSASKGAELVVRLARQPGHAVALSSTRQPSSCPAW